MKKVLLATTAVVLSASVASAEIAVSGSARMGLVRSAGVTTIDNRFTVNFDGSTETTSGLTFGARIRMRSNDAGAATLSGTRVYVKSGNIEVAVGNINGAIDSMPNLYHSEVGYTYMGAGDVATVGYDGFNSNGAGSNGIEAIYSAGAFSAHVSYSDNTAGGISGGVGPERSAFHVAYTMNDWTVALGHQKSNIAAEKLTVLTVAGNIGDYGVGFSAADNAGATKMTLAGSGTFGATGVQAFVTDEEGAPETGYGIGMTYDLGGATVAAGVQSDTAGARSADLGVSFSF
jgi:outer membrane protein OmpU